MKDKRQKNNYYNYKSGSDTAYADCEKWQVGIRQGNRSAIKLSPANAKRIDEDGQTQVSW
jgi:hypothetical protein